MQDNFSQSQTVRKPAVVSERGVVAAQHRCAAEVGAAVRALACDAPYLLFELLPAAPSDTSDASPR